MESLCDANEGVFVRTPKQGYLKHCYCLFQGHIVNFILTQISSVCGCTEVCPVPCGSHGVCSEGRCQCEDGWEGMGCDQRACHPRCEEHGQCRDGKCECHPGWEGDHCTIDGCPGLCNGNGRCTLEQSGWHCVCQAGWSGVGCNVVMETECADNTDNDGGRVPRKKCHRNQPPTPCPFCLPSLITCTPSCRPRPSRPPWPTRQGISALISPADDSRAWKNRRETCPSPPSSLSALVEFSLSPKKYKRSRFPQATA
ncbi:hypothetical protein JZ751_018729, partial [Albula glossodonta]